MFPTPSSGGGFTTDPTTGEMFPTPSSGGGFTTDPTTGEMFPTPSSGGGGMGGGRQEKRTRGNRRNSNEHSRMERKIQKLSNKMNRHFNHTNKYMEEDKQERKVERELREKEKENELYSKIYSVIHQHTRIKLNICLNNNMGTTEICEGAEGIDFSLGNSQNNFILKFGRDDIVYNLMDDMLSLNNNTLVNENKSFEIIRLNNKKEKYDFFKLDEKQRIGDHQHIYPVCVLVTKQNPNYALQIVDANYKNVFYLKNMNDPELRYDYNFYKSFIFHFSDTKDAVSYATYALNTMTEEHINNVQQFDTNNEYNEYINNVNSRVNDQIINYTDLNPKENFTNTNTPLRMTEENFKKTQNKVNNKEQVQCETFDPSKHYKKNNIPCRGCNFK